MLLLLPILAAVTTIDPGSSAKFLGWTADGHHVVWTASDRESSADEESGGMSSTLDESASIAIVHDIRRGDRKVFLIKYTAHTARGRKAGTLKKKYASAGAPAAFDSWKKANPLTMTADRKSKTGTANIAVKLDEGSSAWKGSSIGWTVENSAKVSLSVTCGKVTNTGDLIEQEMSATYQPEWKATPYWDPAGRHVAFLMQEAVAKTMRGPEGGRSSIVLVPCGTRISVVAPASAIAEQDKVAAALEKTGYNVVDLGPAKAKRAATVVYASAKHTAEAEALAKKIPGGATVEKLTWKPKADIVVAVGDSAK